MTITSGNFIFPFTIHCLAMVLFPNCKINLGLNILQKREDGYHDLETVFYPVGLQDALEVIRSEGSDRESGVQFSSSGLEFTGEPNDNLCVKAYHLLKKDFPQLSPVQVHLHKVIPMGAGLGGGSADGAFTLKLLDRLYQLGLSADQLISYALQLGSDCPFFLSNVPSIATGRGEKIQEISLDLSGYTFVIVNPGIHVSTAKAFAGIKPRKAERSIREIIQQPISEWRRSLINDFEIPVSEQYPQIAVIKNHLYANGAVYASMTGSGSSVYGLFEKGKEINLFLDLGYLIYKI